MTQPEPIVRQHRTMTCEGKLLGGDITLMQQKNQADGVETSLLRSPRVLGNAKSRKSSNVLKNKLRE